MAERVGEWKRDPAVGLTSSQRSWKRPRERSSSVKNKAVKGVRATGYLCIYLLLLFLIFAPSFQKKKPKPKKTKNVFAFRRIPCPPFPANRACAPPTHPQNRFIFENTQFLI
jgi:hypothetical protein